MPEQFDRLLVAIRFEHAGAPQFHESACRDWRRSSFCMSILARRVEAAVLIRDFLAQETVGSDDFRLQPTELVALQGGVVDDEQMVAIGIEGVRVSRRVASVCRVRNRRHFLVENVIAQPLRLS